MIYLRQHIHLLLILFSAMISVAAYLQALNFPFVYDDLVYIVTNHELAELHSSELWQLFTKPYNQMYEFLPLRELSYWLDMTMFGLNPAAFRLDSILLYLLCLPLVYATTLAIWKYFYPSDTAAPWAAALVTTLFALHPALVESVVWVSGRKYILPNLFSMLAIWFAVNVRREHGFSVVHAIATLVALVAVMLSKSSYIAIAPIITILWLIFWFEIPKSNRPRALLLWPLALCVLAVFLLRIFVVSSDDKYSTPFGVETIIRALAILGWLARLAVSPESRHYFYPVYEYAHFNLMVVLGGAVFAVALASLVMVLRKRSLEGFSLIAFSLLCFPYLQLIPYVSPSLVQDRYLALAVWPTSLLVVALAWRLSRVPRTIMLLLIILLWGFQTIERPRDWQSFDALVESDFRAFPGYSWPARYRMVNQLSNGEFFEAEQSAKSISTPEIRNVMIKLVQAHEAVTNSLQNAEKDVALDILADCVSDMNKLPTQAANDSTLVNMWLLNRLSVLGEYERLVRGFPFDSLIKRQGKLAQVSFINATTAEWGVEWGKEYKKD